MKLDELNLLVSETSEWPGSHGDSCANTARLQILTDGNESHVLSEFFVTEGNVRHPSLNGYVDGKGESWGYDDFSVDQWIPLFIACALFQPILAKRMLIQLQNDNCRVGDGSLVNLMFVSVIARFAHKSNWLKDIPILLHALGTLIPWRWSDSKKWIERSDDSSADYLNWFMCVYFAYKTNSVTLTIRLAQMVVDKRKLFCKIEDYFKPESNSELVVSLFEAAINEVY